MKKTSYCLLLVVLIGVTTKAMPQYLGNPETHVIEAPNFKGKNICVNITNPSVANSGNSIRPLPIIKTETEIGHQEANYRRNAKHTITIAELGTVSVDEERTTAEACVNLPLDRFDWRDDADGQHSSADFCLSSPGDSSRVHVRVSAQSTNASRAIVKSTLVGMAACQIGIYPSPYNSSDKYSVGDTLKMGPYVLANTPR